MLRALSTFVRDLSSINSAGRQRVFLRFLTTFYHVHIVDLYCIYDLRISDVRMLYSIHRDVLIDDI